VGGATAGGPVAAAAVAATSTSVTAAAASATLTGLAECRTRLLVEEVQAHHVDRHGDVLVDPR
jgi:hypothetical protein